MDDKDQLILDLTTLCEQRGDQLDALENALAGLVSATNMKLDRHSHALWLCPICRAESRSLTELEYGIGHKPDCEFAEARALLIGTANE